MLSPAQSRVSLAQGGGVYINISTRYVVLYLWCPSTMAELWLSLHKCWMVAIFFSASAWIIGGTTFTLSGLELTAWFKCRQF